MARDVTVTGILLPDQPLLLELAAALARNRSHCLESVMKCRIYGGGVRLR